MKPDPELLNQAAALLNPTAPTMLDHGCGKTTLPPTIAAYVKNPTKENEERLRGAIDVILHVCAGGG